MTEQAYTQDSLIALVIEPKIKELGSQKALAKELGISAPYLNDILHYHRLPSSKFLATLGLKKEVLYVKL